MRYSIGIGERVISESIDDVLVTHALASCVAVTIYCKIRNKAGMIHIALPSKSKHSMIETPWHFADVGLPLFIEEMLTVSHCCKSDFDVCVYGGAESKLSSDIFQIGLKNLQQVEKTLRSYTLNYKFIATGGHLSRTIELSVRTGNIEVFGLPLLI